MVRKHIVFYGRVQGVGFRYRARRAADMIGATGWVRNEVDGSVTMEIQGTEEEIRFVLDAIGQGRYVRVERMVTTIIPVILDERGFGRG